MVKRFYSGNDYDIKKFATELYNTRTKLGLDIHTFAKYIDMSYTTYYQNEKGKVTKISERLIDKLCEKFDTTPDKWLKPLNNNCLSVQTRRWLGTQEAIPYIAQAYQKYQQDKKAELDKKAKEIGAQM